MRNTLRRLCSLVQWYWLDILVVSPYSAGPQDLMVSPDCGRVIRKESRIPVSKASAKKFPLSENFDVHSTASLSLQRSRHNNGQLTILRTHLPRLPRRSRRPRSLPRRRPKSTPPEPSTSPITTAASPPSTSTPTPRRPFPSPRPRNILHPARPHLPSNHNPFPNLPPHISIPIPILRNPPLAPHPRHRRKMDLPLRKNVLRSHET